MLTKHKNREEKLSIVTLESIVPKDHYLRKIDAIMDFEFIYDYVEDMYGPTGRPSIDPVVLVKYALLEHLENRNSMRATFREAEVNVAHRWFLGYALDEKMPHFSDFSKTYKRKFSKVIEVKDKDGNIIGKKTIFEILFDKVLETAIENNFIYLRHVYMDSTHIKANANKKKTTKIEVDEIGRSFQKKLDEEIDAYCEEKGLNKPKEVELGTKTVTKSNIDGDCGIFHKGEHELQAAYLAQTICDMNGFILGTDLNPANLHDSTTFSKSYQKLINQFKVGDEGICSIGLDAGYKTPAISKEVIDSGVTPLMPYTRPKGNKYNEDHPVKMGKKDFTYDKSSDTFICPNGKELTPRGACKKTGYITYRSNKKDCDKCPLRSKCLSRTTTTKTMVRHIWQDKLDEANMIRLTEYHARYYPHRSRTIERVFADAKEKYGMRFTRLRGINKVLDEVRVVFTCLNLKKIANWSWNMA